MLTSYHVHSTISDGTSTISELIEAAIDQELDELGISDHYVLLKDGKTVSWSMPLDELSMYIDKLYLAQAIAGDKIVLKFGIEADFDPASANDLAVILESHLFDYVIGSVHYVDGFSIDEAAEYWDELTDTQRNDMMRAYWSRIAEMARSGLFDIAGHLDLYKKFGHRPTVDISEDILAALDAIAQAGMSAEINTSGWFKAADEAYPSAWILGECRSRNIPVMINADAHSAEHLIRGYDKAKDLLHQLGFNQTVVYTLRKPKQVPL